MRNRRRERYEDKRLDWRDPNMPVVGKAYDNDGNIVLKTFDPEQWRKAAEARFIQSMMRPDLLPNWRKDPTYNMKRKR